MFLDIGSIKGQFPVKVDKQLISTETCSSSSSVLAVRYGFRPDSLSSDTSLLLEKDSSEYVLSSQSKNPSEQCVFRGNLSKAKDVECILLFDPVTKSFTLSPLSYTLRVNPSREKPKKLLSGVTLNNSSNNNTPLATPLATPTGTPVPSAASSPATRTKPLTKPLSEAHAGSSSVGSSASSGGSTTKLRTKKLSNGSANALSPKLQNASVTKTKPSVKSKKLTSFSEGRGSIAKSTKPKNNSKSTVNDDDDGDVAVVSQNVGKRASKKVPNNNSQKPQKSDDHMSEDDDDDALLGALANELEESLEDESNGSHSKMSESDISDADDEDFHYQSTTKLPVKPASNGIRSVYSSPAPAGQPNSGPISLKGLVKGSSFSKEEEELSSSEEE